MDAPEARQHKALSFRASSDRLRGSVRSMRISETHQLTIN
jgi:hypothetical protein